jgi:hypothetical protein
MISSSRPDCAMLTDMDVEELQMALGAIVLESAYLERVLRAAFGALVGSKYAAVIDGRMTAHSLIEDCHNITRMHTGITEAKPALVEALNACAAVNTRRNRAIHDAWAYRPGHVMVTLQSQRNSQDVTAIARTVDELRELAGQIQEAAGQLAAAILAALGSGSLRVEDQLRAELGQDISADLG